MCVSFSVVPLFQHLLASVTKAHTLHVLVRLHVHSGLFFAELGLGMPQNGPRIGCVLNFPAISFHSLITEPKYTQLVQNMHVNLDLDVTRQLTF